MKRTLIKFSPLLTKLLSHVNDLQGQIWTSVSACNIWSWEMQGSLHRQGGSLTGKVMGSTAWEQGLRREVWEYLPQLRAWQCRAFCGLKSRDELRGHTSQHSVPVFGFTWCGSSASPSQECAGAVSQGQGKDMSHVKAGASLAGGAAPDPHQSSPGCSWSLQRGQGTALFLQEEHPRGPMHPTLPPISQQLPGREHPFIPGHLPCHTHCNICVPVPKLDPPGAGAGPSRHRFLDILSDFLFLKYENNISLCLCRERSGWVCSSASGRASNVLCRVWKGWLPPALPLMTLAAAADLAHGPRSPRWFSSHLSWVFPSDLLPPGQS